MGARPAGPRSGFTRLGELRTELNKPNLLLGLFRATKETRPLLDLMTAMTGPAGQRGAVVAKVVRRLWLPLLIWLSAGFALTAALRGPAHRGMFDGGVRLRAHRRPTGPAHHGAIRGGAAS